MRASKALRRLRRAMPGRVGGPQPKEPMLGAGLVGLSIVERVAQDEWRAFERVTSAAEQLIGESDEVDDLVRLGLIEGMHNAASHRREPGLADQLQAALPPGCRALWDDVHHKLVGVADWMLETHQTMQRGSADDITDEELSRLFRINYWRTPDGDLVGQADVVDHDEDAERRDRFGFS